MKTPPPLKCARLMEKTIAKIWRHVDTVRDTSGPYPEGHWLSVHDASVAIMQAEPAMPRGMAPMAWSLMISAAPGLIAGLAPWRITQGIYVIDKGLAPRLWDSKIAGEIPTDRLLRLPEPATYIDLEASGIYPVRSQFVGVLAYLDPPDEVSPGGELRLLAFLKDEPIPATFPIHLGEGGLSAGIQAALDTMRKNKSTVGSKLEEMARLWTSDKTLGQFHGICNLLLWLCQDKPELTDEPRQINLKKVRRGPPRSFPPHEPRRLMAGVHTGGALKRAEAAARELSDSKEETGTGKPAPPHVRRAHWHTYWCGPKDNPHRELRWIAPILVNADPELDKTRLCATWRNATKGGGVCEAPPQEEKIHVERLPPGPTPHVPRPAHISSRGRRDGVARIGPRTGSTFPSK